MGYGQKRRLKLMRGAHPVQLLETQYLTNEGWLDMVTPRTNGQECN